MLQSAETLATSTPVGRHFVNMLGAIAEFEAKIRKARQRERIDGDVAKEMRSHFKGRLS